MAWFSLIAQLVKNLPAMQEIPGSGRSPREGNGNPLQYSCLENPWTEESGRLQSLGSRERLQHNRLLCPPLSPRVCSNSCPLRQWCYLIISPSVTPIFSCLPSFPASGFFSLFFPMNQLFPSSGQSIGASASASVLPMNNQGGFPLGLTGWISLEPKGLSS